MTGDSESGLPGFTRRFFGAQETLTTIGRGAVGGKAAGLRLASEVIEARGLARRFAGVHIVVPTLSVIASDAFDAFVAGPQAGKSVKAVATSTEADKKAAK